VNKWELDNYIRRITPFEDALRNKQELKLLKPLVRGEHVRKYPLFDNRDIIDNIIGNSAKEDDKLVFASEGISFCCHPRFLMTPLHSHSFIEMIYVYSGQCRQIINDVPVTMHEGDICIIGTDVHHLVEAANENDIIVNCLMSRSYLENVLLSRLAGNDIFAGFFVKAMNPQNAIDNYRFFHSGQSEKINQFMNYLLCEVFDRSVWSEESINSFMVLVLSELLSIYTGDSERHKDYLIKNVKLSDIILYIQDNCDTATLTSTADNFHFSYTYLSAMLRKLTGHKFTEILQAARLRKACLLLNNSAMAIERIANSVGYQNINFFYQIFKKRYGVTPTEYRKNVNATGGN